MGGLKFTSAVVWVGCFKLRGTVGWSSGWGRGRAWRIWGHDSARRTEWVFIAGSVNSAISSSAGG